MQHRYSTPLHDTHQSSFPLSPTTPSTKLTRAARIRGNPRLHTHNRRQRNRRHRVVVDREISVDQAERESQVAVREPLLLHAFADWAVLLEGCEVVVLGFSVVEGGDNREEEEEEEEGGSVHMGRWYGIRALVVGFRFVRGLGVRWIAGGKLCRRQVAIPIHIARLTFSGSVEVSGRLNGTDGRCTVSLVMTARDRFNALENSPIPIFGPRDGFTPD